ncbi:ribose-5-phosphate isomerase RpiA [Phenylobacterium sp.]|uniref:ribose-5-phosphate isomerase RpiA n=1 Tax=Phenylobacterium sp. TaxID=1871053 RepID=UPI0008AB94B7|nr:ribose-5-phosphate isomerase RpiA [Phenylobacterium sp.]MBA4793876.1 ribose-5-phosphate isomerase RpiA [Phenylobacterium sp.]MBC7168042.1 ribose-5-phosphate isomerase RpiA [Phenylobacterium sp.]OHB40393.1 MAG: ribose 5-phosphate isomerase A [Phenylobacterium sp. RIFCSPHIGHO2_01_FULL_70_10]
MDADAQKRAAGEAAAALVEPGMTVGLGTGSTAAWFVKALAARGIDVLGVPTSLATAELAQGLGVRLGELGQVKSIDLTVDGADEIGPALSLIKGGGAALLREKLVWEASKRCVVIADAAKQVKTLGKFPLPIEVVAFGHETTALRICDALAECDLGVAPRLRMKDGAPVRTDGGNLIYDAACGRIEEPAALADALKSVTGVVDHGLFLDLADMALVGTPDGVITLEP